MVVPASSLQPGGTHAELRAGWTPATSPGGVGSPSGGMGAPMAQALLSNLAIQEHTASAHAYAELYPILFGGAWATAIEERGGGGYPGGVVSYASNAVSPTTKGTFLARGQRCDLWHTTRHATAPPR